MSRSLWFVAAALVIAIAIPVTEALAAKPVPPPPPPTIVAQLDGYAFASDGTVYEFATTGTVGDACTPSLASAVVYGRFFTAPPVSPITSVMNLSYGFQATSANGDMWFLNRNNFAPCYLTGLYMGNIFTVAGTASGAAVPPVNLAPVRLAPETSKDGAPAAHGPQGAPVAGAVE